MSSDTRQYGIKIHRGGFATVYACPCCKFTITVKRERNAGRGFGLRTGGAAWSQMCAHVRSEHPDQPKENPNRRTGG